MNRVASFSASCQKRSRVSIVPLYHPAAAFYNAYLKEALSEDFQVLKQFISR